MTENRVLLRHHYEAFNKKNHPPSADFKPSIQKRSLHFFFQKVVSGYSFRAPTPAGTKPPETDFQFIVSRHGAADDFHRDISLQVINSQKINRLASMKSVYTSHRAFSVSKLYV
jgi:hypothetical protein